MSASPQYLADGVCAAGAKDHERAAELRGVSVANRQGDRCSVCANGDARRYCVFEGAFGPLFVRPVQMGSCPCLACRTVHVLRGYALRVTRARAHGRALAVSP